MLNENSKTEANLVVFLIVKYYVALDLQKVEGDLCSKLILLLHVALSGQILRKALFYNCENVSSRLSWSQVEERLSGKIVEDVERSQKDYLSLVENCVLCRAPPVRLSDSMGFALSLSLAYFIML